MTLPLDPFLYDKGAILSDDGLYRYRLWRRWEPVAPRLAWIMLNPSTADAELDDPTIRRCAGFAKAWGYGSITVVNVYAYRSTDPAALSQVSDPFGPDNDFHLRDVILGSSGAVAAWGAHPGATAAFREFVQRTPLVTVVGGLVTLGMTKSGHPRHPLYVKGDTRPERWRL
jgi:hypothetical protein